MSKAQTNNSANLHIGRSDGAKFHVPARLVTETTAVLGRRGSGKTNTGVVATEELLDAGQQVVVLDPLDVWWGLRSSRSGKSAGYGVVVIGGAHADLPIGEADAAALADFVVDQRLSCIVCIAELSKKGQKRFAADFAERLYENKRQAKHRAPLLVAIDEARQFVPQRVTGETSRLVGAVEDLVRSGRAFGLGVMLIDQRPASINKDVLTQCEMLVCHQVTSPQDRKALEAWIEAHDDRDQRSTFMQSLASLELGEAWVWSPAWLDVFQRVKVRQRRTFDSSSTPELEGQAAEPTQTASVDLDQLKHQLQQTVEQAKANDPAALRQTIEKRDQRIAELERQLAEAEAQTGPDPAAIEKAIVERDREWREAVEETLEKIRRSVPHREQIEPAKTTSKALDQVNGDASQAGPAASGGKRASSTNAGRGTSPSPAKSSSQLGGAEGRILESLGWWAAVGIAQPTRHQVAFVAGYTVNGHFNNTLGKLRGKGLVDYPGGGRVALTETGAPMAPAPDGQPSFDELCDRVRGVLAKPAMQQLMDQVVDACLANGPVSREALAERAGYTVNGHFNNMLGRLRSLGVIDYPQRGQVGLGEVFTIEETR